MRKPAASHVANTRGERALETPNLLRVDPRLTPAPAGTWRFLTFATEAASVIAGGGITLTTKCGCLFVKVGGWHHFVGVAEVEP